MGSQLFGALASSHACCNGLFAFGLGHHHVDRAGHGHAHGIKGPALRFDRRLEDGDALSRLLDRGKLIQQQIVAPCSHFFDGLRTASPHPQRRMGLLGGGGLNHHIVKLPVFALVGPTLIRRPGFDQDRQRLIKALFSLFHGDAEAGKFVVPIAFANAQIEPTA